MMNKKKVISLALTAVLAVGSLAGCGGTGTQDDGKVSLTIGNWPSKSADETVMKRYTDAVARFNELYPDIELITGDTYTYDSKTFNARAAAGQLPNFLDTNLTEVKMLMDGGYTTDITGALKKNDLYDKINPNLLSLITDKDGNISGFPVAAYAMGLVINKSIFKKAGLVNADGSVMIPQTYDELAEYCKIIKDKTGIAGLSHPTVENCGGWVFLNIAWSYGVNFEEQQEDGSWKAVFDTQEFRDALKYMYDLRWKYNGLPDNKVLNYNEFLKTFAVGQAAMTIAAPSCCSTFTQQYGMNIDDIVFASLPAGPKGRYSQIGGSIRMFFNGNTEAQNDAGIKWLMLNGYTPEITPEAEATMIDDWKIDISEGGMVFPEEIFPVWTNKERAEKYNEIVKPYANVDMNNFKDYMEFEKVTLRPEETACCQELYAVLDSIIQELWTNKDADIDALTKQAVEDFQKNHLDKMDY